MSGLDLKKKDTCASWRKYWILESMRQIVHDCAREAVSHGINQSFIIKSERHACFWDNPCAYRLNQNSTSMQITLAEKDEKSRHTVGSSSAVESMTVLNSFRSAFLEILELLRGYLRLHWAGDPVSRSCNVVSKSFWATSSYRSGNVA